VRNPWLCVAIVIGLAAAGSLGLLSTVVIAVWGPDRPIVTAALLAVSNLASGALGALSSFLVQPPRGQVGMETVSGIKPPIPAATTPQTP